MSANDELTSRVIRDIAQWEAIRPAWDELYAGNPAASPPLDFVWLRRWWGVYGETYGPGGLRVVTVWRGTRLIAAAPLYLCISCERIFGVRSLRFISTGEAEHEETCPEYLDLLCRTGDEEVGSKAVWAAIEGLTWDCLELRNLSADAVILREGSVPANATAVTTDTCAIADLSAGFDAYVESLSARNRKQVRKLLREGDHAGAQFEMVGLDQLPEALDDLIALHGARWAEEGKQGAFASPRFVAFHRGLLEEWLPSGRAVLARMHLGGAPAAALYGFVTGQKFDFYQSGVRRDVDGVESPGILGILLLMKALAERGVTVFDFLGGSAVHKKRMQSREQPMVSLRLWRPTLRSAAYHSIRGATRIFRRRAAPPRESPVGASS